MKTADGIVVFNEWNSKRYGCVFIERIRRYGCLFNGKQQRDDSAVCVHWKRKRRCCVFNDKSRRHCCVFHERNMVVCSTIKADDIVVCSMKETCLCVQRSKRTALSAKLCPYDKIPFTGQLATSEAWRHQSGRRTVPSSSESPHSALCFLLSSAPPRCPVSRRERSALRGKNQSRK